MGKKLLTASYHSNKNLTSNKKKKFELINRFLNSIISQKTDREIQGE